MFDALRMLAEHGNGDISHDSPTALVHNTPMVNLRTALALEARGYVLCFEQPEWQTWGGVELQEAGRRVYAESAAFQDNQGQEVE